MLLIFVGKPLSVDAITLASQNAFSKLPEPGLIDLGEVESVDELVTVSDIVIVGVITEKGETLYSKNEYSPDAPETALKNKVDKGDKDPFQMTFNSYHIEVMEYLKGNSAVKNIILVQPIYGEGYEPCFQIGDQLVFFLTANEVANATNTFIAYHPHASYIYINQGDIINPVYKKNEFASLTNKSLSNLKKLIDQSITQNDVP
jgi:hypothetical protein